MAFAAHHASEGTTTTLKGFADGDLQATGHGFAPQLALLQALHDRLGQLRQRDTRRGRPSPHPRARPTSRAQGIAWVRAWGRGPASNTKVGDRAARKGKRCTLWFLSLSCSWIFFQLFFLQFFLQCFAEKNCTQKSCAFFFAVSCSVSSTHVPISPPPPGTLASTPSHRRYPRSVPGQFVRQAVEQLVRALNSPDLVAAAPDGVWAAGRGDAAAQRRMAWATRLLQDAGCRPRLQFDQLFALLMSGSGGDWAAWGLAGWEVQHNL